MAKIQIDENSINRLKVAFYERWNPEEYGYMTLEIPSGAIVFTNDLDCDGNLYFCHKSFLKTIKKIEIANDN